MSEMVREDELFERWQRLDPIFIMGRQRTGTSIVWRALRAAGFFGFPEGHLWFDLVGCFARFRDPEYKQGLRQEIFTLGSGRRLELERRFALLIDGFHRNHLPSDLVRWVDKSPGRYSVVLAPMLAELFPQSQFIFVMRNPITTVNSAVNYVVKQETLEAARVFKIFRVTCEHWVQVMRTWRQVRPFLAGRYIEVVQEHIVEAPDQVAERISRFLGAPQCADAMANVFKTRRENTAFPNRGVGDFFYPMDWTDEQKAMLTDICGEEMRAWGYPLDFDYPAGPDLQRADAVELESMDKLGYYQWSGRRLDDRILVLERRLLDLERQLAEYRQLLTRIGEGRVMRVLNRVDRMLYRLGVRASGETKESF